MTLPFQSTQTTDPLCGSLSVVSLDATRTNNGTKPQSPSVELGSMRGTPPSNRLIFDTWVTDRASAAAPPSEIGRGEGHQLRYWPCSNVDVAL